MPRFGAFQRRDVTLLSSSGAFDELPSENALTRRPGEWTRGCEGPGGTVGCDWGGCFDIDADSKWLDFKIKVGAGVPGAEQSIEIGIEQPWRSKFLAVHVLNKLQAIDPDLYVEHDALGRWVFGIDPLSGKTVSILWASGTHAALNCGTELGHYAGADTPYVGEHIGSTRYSTHHYLEVEDSSGGADAMGMFATLLEGNDLTDFSDVRVMGSNAIVTRPTRERLNTWAGYRWPVSLRPETGFNQVQGTPLAGGPAPGPIWPFRYWYLSWRHHETSDEHRIGLAAWFGPVLQSEVFTVRTLDGHEPLDPTEPMGPDNLYPTQLLPYWRCPVSFGQWSVDDWRATGHRLYYGQERGGPKADPVFWMLNHNDVVDYGGVIGGYHLEPLFATKEAILVGFRDELANGLGFYGVIEEAAPDAFRGARSGYIDAELVFRQIRR